MSEANAYLVAQSDEVSTSVGGEESGPATVIGVDLQRDLAALRIDDLAMPAVDKAHAKVLKALQEQLGVSIR